MVAILIYNVVYCHMVINYILPAVYKLRVVIRNRKILKYGTSISKVYSNKLH